jgi:predicted signal transduction protein with EAL and GGDEF domain
MVSRRRFWAIAPSMNSSRAPRGLDDFGTGYSSLDYLRRFSVDRLKIAQIFISRTTDSPSDAAIVKAAIGLARELNIRGVAEGVRPESRLGCSRVEVASRCKAIYSRNYCRPFARFSGPETSTLTPSLADFITTTFGFRFSVHTG